MTTRSAEHVRGVRIDVPLTSSCAYLFVDPGLKDRDPWWATLYAHLLGLAPDPLDWQHEPVQDVFVARLPLTDERRSDIVRFLRTAPAREVEQHRTLRRAVELTGDKERRLEVVFFAEAPR